MKNWNKLFLGTVVSFSLFTASCSSDDDSPVNPQDEYTDGFFVLNEGNFGASNASVSFVGNDGSVENDIFQSVNGSGLGDVAQSMLLDDDRAYIVVNGSNTIEVVNRYTFESIGTISTGLMNPRYMVIENGKGYVSNWGDPTNPDDDFIAVINLSALNISTTISVKEGPEKMLDANGKIYVAHAGGYGTGNSVSIINTSSDIVETTNQVGDLPNSLVEVNGVVYILCSGKPAWTGEETSGGLYMIDSDGALIALFQYTGSEHPSQLVEDQGNLYYTIDNQIFSIDLNLTSPSLLFTATTQGGIYAFEVEDNKVFIGDPVDFISDGKLLIYSLTGNLENTLSVGPLPNGIYF